jgi:hypothetical protein
MYVACYDQMTACLLFIIEGKTSDADYAEMISALEKQNRDAKQKNIPLITFWLLSELERPNATWRAKLAQVRRNRGDHEAYIAIVSKSNLLRGMLRTINWLVPAPPSLYIDAFTTFEDSIRGVEAKLGRRVYAAETLHYQAYKLLSSKKQSVSLAR